MCAFCKNSQMRDIISNIWRNTITVAELQKLDHTSGKNLFVDVREQHEWDAGHISWFTHIPLSTISEHMETFKKYDRIFFICRSGGRSGIACDILKDLKEARVADHAMPEGVNILGGMIAWESATPHTLDTQDSQ